MTTAGPGITAACYLISEANFRMYNLFLSVQNFWQSFSQQKICFSGKEGDFGSISGENSPKALPRLVS